MLSIEKCLVPANTMLDKYSMNGAYIDCYSTEIPGQVAFPEYIFAFYTTLLFKLERFILKLTVSEPSTDNQASQLANSVSDKFAAWHVEGRSENEILMCDLRGRTRSWLMVAPVNTVSKTRTRLYFGSAVILTPNPKIGDPSLGFGFQLLLVFHKLYSVLLLYSAKSRLKDQHSKMPG